MTAAGQELLEMIPEMLHDDQTTRALFNAAGEERDLMQAQIDVLERNISPSTADVYLPLHEMQLGITVNSTLTDDQRRVIVLAFLSRVLLTGSLTDFVSVVNAVLGSGWRLETHDPTDAGSPPPDHVVITIPYASSTLTAVLAETLLASIVPATVIFNVTYAEGFILDVSGLDDDLLG